MKLAELSKNSFERKNVTFSEVKTNSDPSYIFSGDQDPHPSMRYALVNVVVFVNVCRVIVQDPHPSMMYALVNVVVFVNVCRVIVQACV